MGSGSITTYIAFSVGSVGMPISVDPVVRSETKSITGLSRNWPLKTLRSTKRALCIYAFPPLGNLFVFSGGSKKNQTTHGWNVEGPPPEAPASRRTWIAHLKTCEPRRFKKESPMVPMEGDRLGIHQIKPPKFWFDKKNCKLDDVHDLQSEFWMHRHQKKKKNTK